MVFPRETPKVQILIPLIIEFSKKKKNIITPRLLLPAPNLL